MAVLACLHHLQLLDNAKSSKEACTNERDRIVHIIQTTCKNLLDDKDGFGYNDLSSAQTYLGLNRNRNFWHEGWVMLALTSAKEYIWPTDAQERCLQILWNGLMGRYTIVDATATGQTNIHVCKNNTIWH